MSDVFRLYNLQQLAPMNMYGHIMLSIMRKNKKKSPSLKCVRHDNAPHFLQKRF